MTIPIIKGYRGFLFIGDLHLAVRPGRRIDDYRTAILRKLAEAREIARTHNLYAVLLGDLLNRAKENNLELLHATMGELQQFKHQQHTKDELPLPLVAGSHDLLESWLTARDAISLFAQSGLLTVLDQPGPVLTLDCEGELVTLWATPAGFALPRSLCTTTSRNIMVTHHDLAFCGMYPGAHELHEIENCDMVVNGHMHTPAPMVLKGKTAFHNPGAVSRVSVDLKKHVPLVSAWTPAHGLNLESHPLKHETHVFDLTGVEVFAATPDELKASLPKGVRLSSFASKLSSRNALSAGRTDDGTVLLDALNDYFNLFEKPPALKAYLVQMLSNVVDSQKH